MQIKNRAQAFEWCHFHDDDDDDDDLLKTSMT